MQYKFNFLLETSNKISHFFILSKKVACFHYVSLSSLSSSQSWKKMQGEADKYLKVKTILTGHFVEAHA